ncbi:MAG: DnaB-like helicase C-terminal domain-containing protein [Sediminibacterium sp.]
MSAELESKVLSAVLKDKQIHVLLQANPDSLFKTHKDIWEFIKNYQNQNGSLPTVNLVTEKYRDFVPAGEIGGTKHHLEELRTEYLHNNLSNILLDTATKLKSNQTVDALNNIIAKTSDLKRVSADIRDIDAVDIQDAVTHFEHIKDLNERGIHGIQTGLAGFDNYLPAGITPGQFGILLAYPAIGKSWLALFMAVQAWKNGRKPLVISLEMTEKEVRNRVYTIMGQGMWSHKKLSSGLIDTESFKTWGKTHLDNKPSFHIVSNDGIGDVSPSVIRGKIDQYSPDIVFIDYIQLMQPNIPTDNEVVKIKNISRELKVLAISAQVPIIAIASATPDDATDMYSVPSLGQVAWSKQLAYDADWVLALGRAQGSTILESIFRKNRHGFCGEFMIDVDFDSGRFLYKDMEDSS